MVKEIGQLGKSLLEKRLRKHGWRPKRIDREGEASNADIRALSLDGERRVYLKAQVSDANMKGSHRDSICFGNAGEHLRQDKSIFNSKPDSFKADIVVGASYDHHDPERSRFIVMPVAFAEKLCRFHCEYWYSLPKKDSTKRDPSFLMYLRFAGGSPKHAKHNEKIRRGLLYFKDRWEILSEQASRLHDESAWDLPD